MGSVGDINVDTDVDNIYFIIQNIVDVDIDRSVDRNSGR